LNTSYTNPTSMQRLN